MDIKFLDLCESLIVYLLLSTCQMSPHGVGCERPDVNRFINILYIGAHIGIQKWCETFTTLFLSNIMNHGESDVQCQISI